MVHVCMHTALAGVALARQILVVTLKNEVRPGVGSGHAGAPRATAPPAVSTSNGYVDGHAGAALACMHQCKTAGGARPRACT